MSEQSSFVNFWQGMAARYSGVFSKSEVDFRTEYHKLKTIYDPESIEINIRMVYLPIGLLTYGDLSGTLDLFDNLPLPPVTHEATTYKFLGQFIQGIFPLPTYMKKSDDFAMRGHTHLLHAWFKENRDLLIWEPENGHFILDNNALPDVEDISEELLPRFRTEAQAIRQWACYMDGRTNIRESQQRKFLENRYPEVKQQTDHILYEQKVEDLACGILASGNLNIMDELIEVMKVRTSKRILALLRLPIHMQDENYLINHRDKLKEWVQQNRDNLVWDEAKGQFVKNQN